MDVSIIIVNWNTREMLKECIRSVISNCKDIDIELLVVDNNSSDGSADMVRGEEGPITLIANDENLGFALANNQGMKIAKGKYVMLLNPDTIVRDNSIQKMMKFYEKLESPGVLTCKLLNPDLTLQKSVNRFYNFWRSIFENRITFTFLEKTKSSSDQSALAWNHDSTKKIDWAHGAVMFYSKEVMDEIGMLDDRFYIYAEEIDYYMRCKKAGKDSWFLHEASIVHYGKASSRQAKSKMFIQNYKSFYLLLKKHYGHVQYLMYRWRTSFYLIAWMLLFTVKREKEMVDLYKDLWRWQLSPESKVKL